MNFDLVPEPKSLHVYVQYPHEDKPRYTIDLLLMECECTGYTIEQAKAAKQNRKPKNCKHLDEVVFRIRQAGMIFGRFRLQEAID